MSTTDFIRVVVSLSAAASPTRPAFGTPLLAAYHTHWTNGDRVRFYAADSVLATLVSEGFATTHPVYRAFEVALAAPTVPAQFALGRRANPMTQALKMTLTDAVVGQPYSVTVVGSDGVSHAYAMVSTGVPATDAATFAALMTATNIGTVTVSTATITLTQGSGLLTDLQGWTPNLTVADATTDPGGSTGLSADLAAILAASPLGWYSLSLDSNSKAEIEIAALAIEATGQGGKTGWFSSPDSANASSATNDLDSDLEASGYLKSFLVQSGKAVLSYSGFAAASQLLALDPGSWAAAYKSLPGVVVDDDVSLTETQRQHLNTMSTSSPGTGGKNGNYYVTASGLHILWPGVTPGGRFIDQTVFIDWLQANVQADVLAAVAGLPRAPLDDFGIGGVMDAIETRMKIGAKPPFGGLELDSIAVTGPTAASLSQASRNARDASGIGATGRLTGAIGTVGIQIVLVP